MASKLATGRVAVAPTPGSPTPIAIGGLKLKGREFTAVLSAESRTPAELSFTDLSSDGMTVWVNGGRKNTTVHYMIKHGS